MFGSIPGDVEAILMRPAQAVSDFLERPAIRSLRFVAFYHLPFLILLPLFVLISPYRLILGGSFSKRDVFGLPTVLILGFLCLGAVFDRMQRYTRAGGIDPERPDYFEMRPDGKNLSLYLHIPVSASVFLFFFHPALGYLGLMATAVFSVYQSIVAWARLREETILRSLSIYVLSAGLLMLPLLGLMVLYNLLKTFRILREIYA
ncbi:MAG: hypothetical protein CMN77_00655 [Spirochaetaceae bacterium]|nr:hypothetical protein [Spirochaetaceae bacterium]